MVPVGNVSSLTDSPASDPKSNDRRQLVEGASVAENWIDAGVVGIENRAGLCPADNNRLLTKLCVAWS